LSPMFAAAAAAQADVVFAAAETFQPSSPSARGLATTPPVSPERAASRSVSPSMMSIHDVLSPPSRGFQSTGGSSPGSSPDSPSIMVLDDERLWQSQRKPLQTGARLFSPGRVRPVRVEKPVRLCTPEPLSARGEQRLMEDNFLGAPRSGCVSARGPSPNRLASVKKMAVEDKGGSQSARGPRRHGGQNGHFRPYLGGNFGGA
jgi:hypothetical protein